MTQYYKKNEDGEFVEADLSQEDINQAVKERVDRVNRKYSDYEDLKKQNEEYSAKQTEFENKINELLTDKANLEDDLKASKLEVEKVRIINEFHIGDDLAEFVTGENVEEMRGRAEKLAHSTAPKTAEVSKIEKPEPKKSDMAKLADSLFGSKQSTN
jgi:predicted nuclease with TOPRIM domain